GLVGEAEQFVNLGPAVVVEAEADLLGLVAEDEAEELAGLDEVGGHDLPSLIAIGTARGEGRFGGFSRWRRGRCTRNRKRLTRRGRRECRRLARRSGRDQFGAFSALGLGGAREGAQAAVDVGVMPELGGEDADEAELDGGAVAEAEALFVDGALPG